MNEKERYLQALQANKGQLSETELGESLGLSEEETRRILSRLLDEHRITFESEGVCDYKPFKTLQP